jgi:hypothetical protein
VGFGEETSDGGTLVRMTFEYVVKYGILGKAMDALMIKSSLKKRSLDNLLAALDDVNLELAEVGAMFSVFDVLRRNRAR